MNFDIVQPFIRSVSLQCYGWRNIYKSIAYDSRLFYIFKGKGTIDVEGTVYPLTPSSLIVFKPGVKYFFDYNENEMLDLFTVSFDFTQEHKDISQWFNVRFETTYNEEDKLDTNMHPIFNEPIYLSETHDFQPALLNLLQEFKSEGLLYRDKMSVLLKNILIDVVRLYGKDTAPFAPIVQELLDFIHVHYAEDIDYECIARQLSYHPYYLNRCLKKATGKTISRYLHEHRLSVAEVSLLSTRMSIEEIAYKTGFKNPAHFSSSFKKQYGMSPNEFRKSQTEGSF